MSAVTGKPIDTIVSEYSGQGYGTFKSDVAEAVVEMMRPIRSEYDRIIKDKEYLKNICAEGLEKAYAISGRTMRKVHKKIGFIQK